MVFQISLFSWSSWSHNHNLKLKISTARTMRGLTIRVTKLKTTNIQFQSHLRISENYSPYSNSVIPLIIIMVI